MNRPNTNADGAASESAGSVHPLSYARTPVARRLPMSWWAAIVLVVILLVAFIAMAALGPDIKGDTPMRLQLIALILIPIAVVGIAACAIRARITRRAAALPTLLVLAVAILFWCQWIATYCWLIADIDGVRRASTQRSRGQ